MGKLEKELPCFYCGLGTLSTDLTGDWRWNIHDCGWSLLRKEMTFLQTWESPLFLPFLVLMELPWRQVYDGYSINRNAKVLEQPYNEGRVWLRPNGAHSMHVFLWGRTPLFLGQDVMFFEFPYESVQAHGDYICALVGFSLFCSYLAINQNITCLEVLLMSA